MSRVMSIVLAFGVYSSSVLGQGALIELYGEGVHRYFSGDYAGANQLLTEVIDGGSVDPRVYYFHGLTQEMLGGDGQADYEVGARMEAEGPLSVDVGMALVRIQGAVRTEIEEARRAARVLALQQQLNEEAARAAQEPQAIEPPGPSESVPPPDAPNEDLFSDGGLRSDATTPDPAQPDMTLPEDEVTNPFGDDPAPAPSAETPDEAAPAADSPFGTEAADPFGTAPAGDAADPFGTAPGGDASDPFGTPPTEDSGAGNPFGAPDGAADPFGTGN